MPETVHARHGASDQRARVSVVFMMAAKEEWRTMTRGIDEEERDKEHLQV